MMGMDPQAKESQPTERRTGRLAHVMLVVLAAATGLGLMTDSLMRSSATYDEVLYSVRGLAMVADRRSDQDHACRHAADILEASASAHAVDSGSTWVTANGSITRQRTR